ncbi:MAG: sigma-70 family RNA polymerase sigma factor [Phycisphaerae bacterium]|nr:sigma-70 family RNA polymerase sigma factor [Phycisphaerae bacterium]
MCDRRIISPHSNARFATTHWSVVRAAGDKADSQRAAALQTLCRTYWYPLYAYVRHRGTGAQDAEDLVQTFFMFLLEKDRLGSLVPDRGRFRSFLVTAMNHFRTDQWKRATAAKRGGGQKIFSLDMTEAEARYGHEPVDTTTPEKLFEMNWAVTLLNTVFEQLQQEQRAQDKGEQFETLKFCLTGQRSTVPYAQLADQLAVSEATLKVMVHRLRKRYRELLHQEIAHTVTGPDEVEDELHSLFQVLAG